MFDDISWKRRAGSHGAMNLTLLMLSGCSICKRAFNYLVSEKYGFRYVELDTLPKESRIAIKQEFRETFDKRICYPVLIYRDVQYLIGFIKSRWDEVLQ